jgi:Uma2 family endonuclease
MAKDWAVPEMGASLADLLEQLGDVPPERIPLRPAPGTAKEADVLKARRSPERWLFELVDGVLVLKPPSLVDSHLGSLVGHAVLTYLDLHDLGVGFAAAAMYRLKPGLVRIPDFTFVAWDRLPGGRVPKVEIAVCVPDLVVELVRPAHGQREVERKVREFLEFGVRVVWLIHSDKRAAEICTVAGSRRIRKDGVLEAPEVLPDFELPLRSLFSEL